MKKLSLLIAMILCVTIGGVYAAWTYTDPAIDITDKGLDTVIGVSLPSADLVGAIGEFGVSTNITGMSIDQLGDDGDPVTDFHQAVLNFHTNDDKAPYIEFTLNLVDNADEDTINDLETQYSIEIIDVKGTYGDKDIFVDKRVGLQNIGKSTSSDEIKWEYDEGRDLYFCKITDFEKEFILNDFILPSKSAHTTFSQALGTPTLKVLLTDGTGA